MKKVYRLEANPVGINSWWDMGTYSDKKEAYEALERKEKVEAHKQSANYVFRVIEVEGED